MIKRVLIANRGEIAIRIIRACRDLGWESIAVYSEGEEDALHVAMADQAYRIESDTPIPYLDQHALIEIARRAGAHFIHPGYGFLAENADFAQACELAELTFVGPTSDAMRTMGDKVEARKVARQSGVPILPGSVEPLRDAAAAADWADEHGYPVALKAPAGGGGRGFRVAHNPEALPDAFAGAHSEADRAFGDGRLYIERYLEGPRHVEIQVFADKLGNVVALGDRDCSIQRRHQKLLEEAPAPNLTDSVRQEMARVSIALARAVNYVGAGTLEFLVEPDGRFWFLEMNTRIQVEHTVTEEIFGVDLVREQLLVASGMALSFDQSIQSRGHAIQFRINAEDPGQNFGPRAGSVTRFSPPLGPGVRIDTAMKDGAVISERFDSMVAKLVVWGRDRDQAISRGKRALDELVVDGLPTTRHLHRNILESCLFASGPVTTSFLQDAPEVIPPPEVVTPGEISDEANWTEKTIEVNGRQFRVRVPDLPSAALQVPTARRKRRSGSQRVAVGASNEATFVSPYQGSVLRIAKAIGDSVSEGDLVLVIEAMKMENEIAAHRGGTLIALQPANGASVKIGEPLFTIE